MTTRLLSFALLLALWEAAALLAQSRLLPAPQEVAGVIMAEARSGALFANLAATLARVAAAFVIAMAAGAALGVAMGRNRTVDRVCDPWLIVLLNLPALVVIVLAYIWIGLNEVAAVGAVALNKLPTTAATLREGARALDRSLDEVALIYHMPLKVRVFDILLPQLGPYLAAATRSGLSLVWKIVLVVELLGRSNGVGFEIGVAFQLFDVARLLGYALPFVMIMLAIETFVVQPLERRATRWRKADA
ncbi:ABC transporter permease [Methylocella sp.]|uniref:ABC transporter permease n=1 Tax=Methylocella sp. TaxID=1978226 RepID=UPI003783C779